MASFDLITSTHNPKIQLARSLLEKAKKRSSENAFVIEGVRLAEEAVRSNWEIRMALFTQSLSQRGLDLLDILRQRDLEIYQVTEAVMTSLSDTETPQGLLVVVRKNNQSLPYPLDFVLVCDSIHDPGNLGTLLRTAGAAGVQAVILSPDTVDAYSPKVLRAGMGAHFHVPIIKLEWTEIRLVLTEHQTPLNILEADPTASQSIWKTDLTQPLAIMVGSEAEGLSPEGKKLAQTRIMIPMPGRAESLNAAMAAGVILFEVVRQRTSRQEHSG